MSFDNTKYHCEINGVPYQIRGYQKSELSTFIPRLGSGDQEESQFDLLRSKTIKSFEGGTLQRKWEDDTSVFATEGLYPKFEDGVLYPINAPESLTSNNPLGTNKSAVTATVISDDYAFVAGRTLDTPTNSIRRIDSAGTVVALTLPASLSGGSEITSMVIHNGQLWIFAANITSAIYYMALTSTTVTAITDGSGHVTKAVVFKGSIYGTSGAYANRILYRYTGNTTTRSWVQVGNTGQSDVDSTASLFVYNNRIFLLRAEGMYAYDGIQMVAVEDSSQNINPKNYRFPAILKGYLYYFMPDGWYRFNGSLIEKLYDISEIGFPRDVFVGKNRIWLMYVNSAYSGSSRYDTAMGYDYSSGDYVDGRVMVFNGKALYTYGRVSTFTKNSATEDLAGQGELWRGFWFKDDVFLTCYYEKSLGNRYFKIDTDELAATGDKNWRIVTSIFDGDFPMVYKNIENYEFVFDGDVPLDDELTIEYRTAGFGNSTVWQGGTEPITTYSQPDLFEPVWNQVAAGIYAKKVQFRIAGSTETHYGLAKFVIRYTLMPDYKNQWQFTALCYGDDSLAPLLLADGTESTQSVQTLRGNLYASRSSYVPIKFVDIDQMTLTAAIDAAVTTVPLDSTLLFKGNAGFMQIDDEIMYWYVPDPESVTVLRGVLGTTAATHAINAKVFFVYRVIVRQIQSERIELDNPESSDQDKSRSSEVTITLQEV